ncbi:hypothetical protein [Streptomyces sp. NPDC019890]|uniref:hypothetical protein n=1 Tax=Streptomyces sp. NPDC019890 TaxID=3365064 RepID=UPI00384C9DD4
MLSTNLLATDAQHHLIRHLLKCRAEIGPEWNRFVARACLVLADAGLPSNAMKLLRALLKCADRLDAPTLQSLHLARPQHRTHPQQRQAQFREGMWL